MHNSPGNLMDNEQRVLIVKNVSCTLDYTRRSMASRWRLLSSCTWQRLGVTRNTVFGFGLPLCKEDIEKVDDPAEDLQEVKGLLCLTKDERLRGLGLFRLAKRELRGEAATPYD